MRWSLAAPGYPAHAVAQHRSYHDRSLVVLVHAGALRTSFSSDEIDCVDPQTARETTVFTALRSQDVAAEYRQGRAALLRLPRRSPRRVRYPLARLGQKGAHIPGD